MTPIIPTTIPAVLLLQPIRHVLLPPWTLNWPSGMSNRS